MQQATCDESQHHDVIHEAVALYNIHFTPVISPPYFKRHEAQFNVTIYNERIIYGVKFYG